ncbi:MAG: hypothetical protein PHV30_08760 [Candidatus Margulisbacteria bacterium]|nr:hypothetical protein [Candidatus Margulisiibacteriota bacterium]
MRISFVLFIIVGFCLLNALDMKTVESLGTGESNIVLLTSAESLVINPAFLSGIGFGYNRESLDTQQKGFDYYNLEIYTLGSFGYGSVKYKEKISGDQFSVNLYGFGMQFRDNMKWGVTLENIDSVITGVQVQTWTTKIGMNYIMASPARMLFGMTLENLFKDSSEAINKNFPPVFDLGVGFIPYDNLLWTHALSYKRLEGEAIHYRTGFSLILDKNFVLTGGINEHGYTTGVEVPLSFGRAINLGKISCSILLPYNIKEDVIYYLSYTFGYM